MVNLRFVCCYIATTFGFLSLFLQGLHKSVLTCGTYPHKGSQLGNPVQNNKDLFVSNNSAVLTSSCSLDDAGQLDVSCSKSTPAALSYQQLDHDSLTNNLLLQQQEPAAALSSSPAVCAADAFEASSAQQQTVSEHAGADCSSANVEGSEASEVAEQSLPMPPSGNEQDSCCVFFARVPPTVPYESILALFQQFGTVNSLNLFRPWASAKTSKVSNVTGVRGSKRV